MTPPAPPRAGLLRRVWCAVFSTVWTMIAFLVGVVCVLLDPVRGRLASRWSSIWGRVLLLGQGIRVRVVGREHFAPGEARMLVANHASWLDPPAVAAAFPGNLRFVLKKELAWLPFIGWFAKLNGHFFIDRAKPREGKALSARILAAARRHALSPLVFPEGTRSRTGEPGPLRTGTFQLALDGDLPVQPMWIEGAFALMPPEARTAVRGGRITVHVGPAIPTAGLAGSAGRKEVARRVEAAWAALQAPA